jgi:hypothetical protein
VNFDDLCHTVHQQMSGRASAEQVAQHVASSLDDDAYRHQTWKGFVGQVRSAMRRRNPETGLPEAPCIDGVYVQESLLTEDEYRNLVAQHMSASARSRRRAEQYAAQAEAIYGVVIALDEIDLSA